jgi:hypothetical protein
MFKIPAKMERERRREVCKRCRFLEVLVVKRCGHCGCLIESRVITNCPQGKF